MISDGWLRQPMKATGGSCEKQWQRQQQMVTTVTGD